MQKIILVGDAHDKIKQLSQLVRRNTHLLHIQIGDMGAGIINISELPPNLTFSAATTIIPRPAAATRSILETSDPLKPPTKPFISWPGDTRSTSTSVPRSSTGGRTRSLIIQQQLFKWWS
jgi:hypothetical protein